MKRSVVLLDTSVIIHALDLGVDIVDKIYEAVDGPVEVCVPDAVLRELERLARLGSATKRRKARVAMMYLERRRDRVKVVEAPQGPVDEAILRAAEAMGAIVATSDASLRRRAARRGLRVLFLWDSRKRVFEGGSYTE